MVTMDWHWVACIVYFVTSNYTCTLTKIVNQWVTLMHWNLWCCVKSLGLERSLVYVAGYEVVSWRGTCFVVKVTASFTSSDTQDFVLSDEFGLTTDDPPSVNTRSRELVYRALPEGDYYWELPEQFTGNKVGGAHCVENHATKMCIDERKPKLKDNAFHTAMHQFTSNHKFRVFRFFNCSITKIGLKYKELLTYRFIVSLLYVFWQVKWWSADDDLSII